MAKVEAKNIVETDGAKVEVGTDVTVAKAEEHWVMEDYIYLLREENRLLRIYRDARAEFSKISDVRTAFTTAIWEAACVDAKNRNNPEFKPTKVPDPQFDFYDEEDAWLGYKESKDAYENILGRIKDLMIVVVEHLTYEEIVKARERAICEESESESDEGDEQ